ncbi:hypothetical protein GOODEAATRI_013139 [Goodea atripinnis]|uniref:Uncharacterized protein n=1 Tax=Goodea atripinnis TaxID=208336 RepID=A0ABV0P3R6_9TELE
MIILILEVAGMKEERTHRAKTKTHREAETTPSREQFCQARPPKPRRPLRPLTQKAERSGTGNRNQDKEIKSKPEPPRLHLRPTTHSSRSLHRSFCKHLSVLYNKDLGKAANHLALLLCVDFHADKVTDWELRRIGVLDTLTPLIPSLCSGWGSRKPAGSADPQS